MKYWPDMSALKEYGAMYKPTSTDVIGDWSIGGSKKEAQFLSNMVAVHRAYIEGITQAHINIYIYIYINKTSTNLIQIKIDTHGTAL